MKKYRFWANIPYSEFEGTGTFTFTWCFQTTCGRKLDIKGARLLPVLSHQGITGLIEVAVDNDGSFLSIEKVG